MRIRIGTRGSDLALAQTGGVAAALRALGHAVDIEIIQTAGDRNQTARYADIGAAGIFVREIEVALLEGHIDAAVHSYKDLPSASPAGLRVAAVSERRDPADHLIARREAIRGAAPQDELLPLVEAAVVGTASARRGALLRALRPDLRIEPIRGNVPTRLDKLRQGRYDAVVLAGAGLRRLESDGREGSVIRDEWSELRLDPSVFVPSPGQGAIAVQCRARDLPADAVTALHDEAAAPPVAAERELLRLLDGGCDLPFGAWADGIGEGELELHAVLGTTAGLRRARVRGRGPIQLARAAWQRLDPGERFAATSAEGSDHAASCEDSGAAIDAEGSGTTASSEGGAMANADAGGSARS